MKIIDRIRALPSVGMVSVEPGDYGTCYFVYLNPGWEWSGQRCFGDESIREVYKLAKEATQISDGKDTP